MNGDQFQKGFPTFAIIILVVGILWALSDLNYITVDVPWLPVILIIVSLGWIVNHFKK